MKTLKNGLVALLATATMGITGCVSDGEMGGLSWVTNPYTPPGYEGYLMHKPLVFGAATYEGSQKGPTSAGLSWRVYITNIDTRPTTYSEDFQILAKDNLEITFAVHTRIKPVGGKVNEIIENYSEHWYERIAKEPFRTFVRDSVKDYSSWQANEQRELMAIYIRKELETLMKGKPFEVQQVVVGNIQYPKRVKEQIEEKLAKQQELERKDTEIEIAKKEAQKKIVEAEGTKRVQDTINATLTPNYLQYKAIEATRELINSPNAKTIILVPMKEGMGMPNLLLTPEGEVKKEEEKKK